VYEEYPIRTPADRYTDITSVPRLPACLGIYDIAAANRGTREPPTSRCFSRELYRASRI